MSLVCGLGEVGRGPLAGPLVAAAVIFPQDFRFAESVPDLHLRDSKKLTARAREELALFIEQYALAVKTNVVTVDEINAHGIGWANRTVFERLILDIEAYTYIVDGNLKFDGLGERAERVQSVVRADEVQEAVSAASIIAKIGRDMMMKALHNAFPMYGWDHNKGYGTQAHIAALQQYGPCRLHRTQFVRTALARKTLKLPGFEET